MSKHEPFPPSFRVRLCVPSAASFAYRAGIPGISLYSSLLSSFIPVTFAANRSRAAAAEARARTFKNAYERLRVGKKNIPVAPARPRWSQWPPRSFTPRYTHEIITRHRGHGANDDDSRLAFGDGGHFRNATRGARQYKQRIGRQSFSSLLKLFTLRNKYHNTYIIGLLVFH